MKEIESNLKDAIGERFGPDATIDQIRDITIGWETQIIAFNLRESGGIEHNLVARIFPESNHSKCNWEYSIMERLRKIGYPVPRVYFCESNSDDIGSPFIVMERIDGGVLWDSFFSNPPSKWNEVLDTTTKLLNELHAIDPFEVFPFRSSYNTQIRVKERIKVESRELHKYGLYEDFHQLIGWLRSGIHDVLESSLCIVHRDFHPRNILLKEDGSPVVIDWGSCVLGDFREDICWTGLLMSAFVDQEWKHKFYDKYFANSLRIKANLDYFEVFNGLRRLTDLYISKKAGAEARGMNPEATKQIIENQTHIMKICDIVSEITGINLNINT